MKKHFNLTIGNKLVTFSSIVLVIFGSLMVASAEMGNSVGDTTYLTRVIVKQAIFAFIGVISYFAIMNLKLYKVRISFYYIFYVGILFALIACRAFGAINGAYAWIWLGSFATIQPSEFAKVFMIVFGAKLFSKDGTIEKNRNAFVKYGIMAIIYFIVIFKVQSDFGSAVVLGVICYCVMMIPPIKGIKKYQNWMSIAVIFAILIVFFLLSEPVTNWMKGHSDNYMIGRFLAAADPFLYRYDNGYHVIMSLVSFANGNIFGLGYGNSIHKYMNFPNPSNDFILPVIVEELGIIGFFGLVIAYGLVLVPLMYGSLKSKYTSTKIVLLGVFVYFTIHFILNVGGVGALIPLTGVPLLLISSGGSSLLASMMSLGFAQAEMVRNRYIDEDNSR